MSFINDLIQTKKVIVCCGAGGVGKTTVSASIALAAARMGKKVLVLTIDPSKRLAEALGISQSPDEPVPLSIENEQAAGIQAPGALSAWILDSKKVTERISRRVIRDPAQLKRLFESRIYQNVTEMIAGMQEYTAMEALYRFVHEGNYDLVVLDTPPSRHALDFLEAPHRLARFLEGKVFQLFLPATTGFLQRATQALIQKALQVVLGASLANELSRFFDSISGLLYKMSESLVGMKTFLQKGQSGFVLVTSSSDESFDEALFFKNKVEKMGLPFSGFVLNRTYINQAAHLNETMSAELQKKWIVIENREVQRAEKDATSLLRLKKAANDEQKVVTLPLVDPGLAGIQVLIQLSDVWID